jgi:hypothetical protein
MRARFEDTPALVAGDQWHPARARFGRAEMVTRVSSGTEPGAASMADGSAWR